MNSASRQLLLLRHAKAVTAMAGMSDAVDHARPLSERGCRDAAAMGALLQQRGLMPERALVSTSARTRETFDCLHPPPASTLTRCFLDSLYLAGADALLDVIGEAGGEATSLLLIGHNPGMHELARALAHDHTALAQGFPTCTLALFSIEGEWSELGAGRARLIELVRPSSGC